jgi:coenzyme Q-binding protein COQ10
VTINRYEVVLDSGHGADALHALVSDVRAYPQFIPWIKALRVDRDQSKPDALDLVAHVLVGFRGLTERFATRVTSVASPRRVEVALVSGPFRHLSNTWEVSSKEGQDGSRVRFEIVYDFRNPVLQLLAQHNFDKAVERLMGAFLAEADRRHGAKPAKVIHARRV